MVSVNYYLFFVQETVSGIYLLKEIMWSEYISSLCQCMYGQNIYVNALLDWI